jgi:transcriptional regulator with XRE-family HTH domain
VAIIRNAVKAMEHTLPRGRVERARSEAAVQIRHIRLAELRKKLGIRQSQVATFSQSAISRLEARTDMKLSTLSAYLDALGLVMEIRVFRKNGTKKDLGDTRDARRGGIVLLRTP